jgi:hypothetical protein
MRPEGEEESERGTREEGKAGGPAKSEAPLLGCGNGILHSSRVQ